ncbi:MAG: DoxX family protein [Pseudomonadota bacterium]
MNKSTIAPGAVILRLALGIVLLAHGVLKVAVFTVPGTVGFFDSLGIPAVFAYLTIAGEIGGGIALLAGVFTRLVALLSLPILIGATWIHWANGWLFTNQGGGWEFPALLAVAACVVAIQGSGGFSIGRIPILDRIVPQFLKV